MTNPTLEALAARKSMRVYTDRPISAEARAAILQAAFEAPTAGCQQFYTIIDVTDPAQKARLADLCDHQPFIAAAPLVLVFLADCARWCDIYRAAGLSPRAPGVGDLLLAAADACIAAQNAVVAAESLGIGSCYIGDVIENYAEMRAALALPDAVVPACMLVFGYPTEQQKQRPKPARFAPEMVVCENIYQTHTAAEWQAAMEDRAARGGQQRYDFAAATAAFMKRKYESNFSREMTRSAAQYLAAFAADLPAAEPAGEPPAR